jgi:hypothetical protein
MRRSVSPRAVLALVTLAALLALVPGTPASRACAPVPHRGESVGVNAEEAVILYDAEYKTEHFIRRANFDTSARDFGFLVPTPTRPELGETKAEVFSALDFATRARHVPSGKTQKVVVKRGETDAAPKAAAPSAPVVLEERAVAGYDAVVLKAEDIDGLKKWLEDRKYDARPALMDWLKWYVEHQWVITAFKITPGHAARQERWEKTVRMSFKTDAPFYPYREPENLRAGPAKGPRSLRVFFLADARYDGTLGQDKRWAGRTVWANPLPADVATRVVNGFGLSAADAGTIGARNWHLTEFEDHSSPRPGTDEVYFRRADDQSTVERPPVVYDHYEYVYEDVGPAGVGRVSSDYVWCVVAGAVLLLGVGAFAAWRAWRRPV